MTEHGSMHEVCTWDLPPCRMVQAVPRSPRTPATVSHWRLVLTNTTTFTRSPMCLHQAKLSAQFAEIVTRKVVWFLRTRAHSCGCPRTYAALPTASTTGSCMSSNNDFKKSAMHQGLLIVLGGTECAPP